MGRYKGGRPLLKIEIERAQASTMSAADAARLLHVSYITYRKYAKLYGIHKINQYRKGMRRNADHMNHSLKRILSGEYPDYEHRRLKARIVNAGILPNECALCSWSKGRPDGKVPLIVFCKDGDNHNLLLENIELRCFNCTYITTGKMVEKSIERMGSGVYEADFKEHIMLSDKEIEELQQEIQQEHVEEEI